MKNFLNVLGIISLTVSVSFASSSSKSSYLDEIADADIQSLDLEKEDYEAILDTTLDNDYEKLDAMIRAEVNKNDSELDRLAEGIDETAPIEETPKEIAKKKETKQEEQLGEKVISDEVATKAAAPEKRVIVDEPVSQKAKKANEDDQIVGGSAPLFQ